MAKNISVGIDIGTYNIKVVVAEKTNGGLPKVIGTGFSESKGMMYGYIINSEDVSNSLIKAIEQAEKTSGIKIKKAYVSVGGISLDSISSIGSTIISRGDSEITNLDVEKAIDSSEGNIPQQEISNKRIIHSIPLGYRIDERPVLGRPVGMKGVKLEAKVLFVTYLEQHLQDLIQAIEDTDIFVQDIIAAPIAASMVTLSMAQKLAGVVLANIGSETVSLIIYDNNIPISLKIFPIGSTDITNKIALNLKVPLEEAEQIKVGSITGADYSKKKLDQIISSKLTDIFELIEAHLKKIKRSGSLPAGVVLTGGGSGVATIKDIAEATLNIPSKIANVAPPTGKPNNKANIQIKDSSWSVSYGLCVMGLNEEKEYTGIRLAKNTGGNILSWIKQFLP